MLEKLKSFTAIRLRKKIAIGFGMSVVMFFLGQCIDPYEAPQQNSLGYLVVDGFLNTSGTDSTIITLTLSQTLNDVHPPQTVINATVEIQDSQNDSYALNDPKGTGKYSIASIPVDVSKSYRLHVRISNKEYYSDYVPVQITPPIDSVGWKISNQNEKDGISIAVNAHDDQKLTTFFRWDFTETWEYTSKFESNLITHVSGSRDTILQRPITSQIYTCWTTRVADNVLIYSTSALSEDKVTAFPLTFISFRDPRLSKRYTILVNQYAMTKESFLYWQSIKKNTENIGGIFGPLPSQVNGNLTCITNPSEPVIGYFTATTRQTQRIFINNTQLPNENGYDDGYTNCQKHATIIDSLKFYFDQTFLDLVYSGGTVTGYSFTSADCADCRLKGGTTVKPDYF